MNKKQPQTTFVEYPPIASGEPVLCDDGYWHVKWTYQDGTARTTEFGWDDRRYAESYVAHRDLSPGN